MSRLPRRLAFVAATAAVGSAALAVAPHTSAPASALGATTPHLVVIMLENKEFTTVVGDVNAPYLNNTMIPSGRLFTSYYAAVHPSLPNYLTITSGQFGSCVSDSCTTGSASQDNLFAQMNRASPRVTWKVYAEDMPSNCYKKSTGAYVVRHNPPPYYSNLGTTCATNDVPLTQLAGDLNGGTLPAFAMVIPNLYNDMHSDRNTAPCALGSVVEDEVCQGDMWLQSHVPDILSDGGRNDVTLLVVFDEGSSSKGGGGRVMLFEQGPTTCAGCTDARAYNGHALLEGIEDWFGLPWLAGDVPGL